MLSRLKRQVRNGGEREMGKNSSTCRHMGCSHCVNTNAPVEVGEVGVGAVVDREAQNVHQVVREALRGEGRREAGGGRGREGKDRRGAAQSQRAQQHTVSDGTARAAWRLSV